MRAGDALHAADVEQLEGEGALLPVAEQLDLDLRAGLAALTGAVLTRGTAKRTGPQLDSAIEFVGGSLEAGAGRDSLSVSLRVLRKDLGLGLDPKDEAVHAQNLELLKAVRESGVKAVIAGDLHLFTSYQDPEKADLMHYSIGAVLKSQSVEKFNFQSPRFAVFKVFADDTFELVDTPIN